MNSLELFSGAGGLAKGLELAGFKHSKFVEFNRHACNSLRANFDKDAIFEGDIKDFDFDTLARIDLIAGGPPCQPFSMAGKHMAQGDKRDMFPYAAKAVSHYRPKAFIFENVKGLLRPSFSNYFSYIILRMTFPEIEALEGEEWVDHYRRLQEVDWDAYQGLKYVVQYKLLNAADYGVPQIRERVFIVGIRADLDRKWAFPQPTHSAEALYRDQYVTKTYWSRHGIQAPDHHQSDCPKFKKTGPSRLPIEAPLKPWNTVRDALAGTPHPDTVHQIPDHIFKDGARTYPGHTGSYIDHPAKTLKAGVHGVPGGENMIRYEDGSVRYFTVYEGKLLQTFGPQFVVTGAWGEAMRQLGNAVPTLLAQCLGTHMANLLAET